ncbi:MAG: archaellin/type IV pilin N-terminal domain-containing protein [Candidatus Caldarchaeum sp.]
MARVRSRGLSPLVAVILLLAITVAAAVVVSGVFFNLAGVAGRRPTAVIDQVRLVATPTGAGTWAVTVKNTGDVPITAITASYPIASCNPALTFTPLPLNPGATASATANVATGCTLGTTYRIVLTITFQDGSQQVLTTQVTAAIA